MARFFFRASSVFCVIAAAALGGCNNPAPTPPTGPLQAVSRGDVIGVENFGKISDGVYRGAQPTAEGFAELKKMGIKTIINLRLMHTDDELLKGTGLNYIHFNSFAATPNEDHVVNCLKIMNDPACQPVFIHCQAGADRTGMIIAAYRMTYDKWSVDEAIKEMPNFRYNTGIWMIRDYLNGVNTAALSKKVAAAKLPTLKCAE
jgi:protein tyrosine/serine phosphatase